MAELPLLIFDLNETLFDLDAITPLFTRLFGDPAMLRTWFNQVVLYSEALTLAGEYVPFGELGGAVLTMVAAVEGKPIVDKDLDELKDRVGTMPPHPDVEVSLRRLREAGFRLFAFTNNPRATGEKQLKHAGLDGLIERTFSVDDRAKRFKPASDAYADVASQLGRPPSDLWLIACHSWDTLGAGAAGWQSALVLRTGNAPLKVGPQPTIVGDTLADVADKLIAQHKPGPLARLFGSN